MNIPFEYYVGSEEPHMYLTRPDTHGSHGVSTACSVDWGCKFFSLNFNIKPDKQL